LQVWQEASTSWQRAVAPLMALMGSGRYHSAGLQDIARFVRNARTHLLEKDATALAAVLGAAPTAASTAVGAGAIFIFTRPCIMH
jgi:hypothetical protein